MKTRPRRADGSKKQNEAIDEVLMEERREGEPKESVQLPQRV
jgi:hypothetical protein